MKDEEIIKKCKLCPFCLSKPEIFEREYDPDYENEFGITCSNCGCKTIGDDWNKLGEAVKSWNTRLGVEKANLEGAKEERDRTLTSFKTWQIILHGQFLKLNKMSKDVGLCLEALDEDIEKLKKGDKGGKDNAL